MHINNLVNLIFEMYHLKSQKRTGLYNAGVYNPSSVAEHTLLSAIIAYILTNMEKATNPDALDLNPERAACMMMVHDMPETRTSDLNSVHKCYFRNKHEVEATAFADQIAMVDEVTGSAWTDYYEVYEKGETLEAKIAKDADRLELAFDVKGHLDKGLTDFDRWLDRIPSQLHTESARRLFVKVRKTHFTQWYQDLLKIKREQNQDL